MILPSELRFTKSNAGRIGIYKSRNQLSDESSGFEFQQGQGFVFPVVLPTQSPARYIRGKVVPALNQLSFVP
jgi:hypothetical protein